MNRFYSRENITNLYNDFKPIYNFIDDSQLRKMIYDIMTEIDIKNRDNNYSLLYLNGLVYDELKTITTDKTKIFDQKTNRNMIPAAENELLQSRTDQHPPVIKKSAEKR